MKKITVSKFALAGIMPVCAILPIIATSCGPKKNTHAMVSDMTPIIDPDTGGAHITAMINTQPLYDEALVSVISKKGEHLVTMYEDGGMPFSHQNSLRLPVKEHMISINLSFYDYVGESTETTFNLEIDYFDKSGKVHTEVVHNLTLSTEYSEKDKETVHILAFNDLHGAATGCGDTDFPNTSYKNPGVMRMAQTFDPILHNNPGSILLSCGDNNSGDAFSTATHGETMYPLLKSLDCRYSAVGNHAFEWGLSDMSSLKFDELARTEKTQGNYFVCGNIIEHNIWQDYDWCIDEEEDPVKYEWDYNIWKTQKAGWTDPFKLISMNGHLVCLLGLTTVTAMDDGNKAIVNGLSFVPYEVAAYYSTRYCYETVGADWYNKIDSFVFLTHLESEQDPIQSRAYEFAEEVHLYEPEHLGYKNTKKISAILSGHSHKEVDQIATNQYTNQPIAIGQASTAGRMYTDLQLTFDNTKEPGTRWIVPTTQEQKDEIIKVEKVDIDYGGKNPESKDPVEKEEALKNAAQEYVRLLEKPKDEYQASVAGAFFTQRQNVNTKLKEVIATSDEDIKYSPLTSGKQLGHEYIMPDHICDQMGAWINMAQIAGFNSLFRDEILSKDSSVTYPAISFINIDSITNEFKRGNISLKDMYQLQTYENPMYFGFMSVWQIANIIDYSLSGRKLFIYGSDKNNDYMLDTRLEVPAPFKNGEHDIIVNYNVDPAVEKKQYVNCCSELSDKMLYLCGSYQWYGMQIKLKKNDEATADYLDRDYSLNYVQGSDGRMYPDMKIYNPGTAWTSAFYDPSRWMTAEEWDQSGKLVPVVVNSFIYEKGSGQSGMFEAYFKYSESLDSVKWKGHKFSSITRDALIEFCRMLNNPEYRDFLHFEISKELSNSLVIYPK